MAQIQATPRKKSQALKTIRREGLGLILLIVLFVVIIGPMLAVVLWAFTIRWQFPSLIPTQWGLSYWTETLSRADIKTALPLSIGLATAVTSTGSV